MKCTKCGEDRRVTSFTGWCDRCLQQMGRQRRDDGMARALNSKEEYVEAFVDYVLDLEPRSLFTSEDVTDAIGLPTGRIESNRNNAVGAAMQSLTKRGVIKAVGHTQSTNPRSNASEIKEWERL